MEDDADLVRRALARDQQAFAELYDRYADKLYDYARRQTGNASDAGDIVQDTFVLAIQRLHQLRDPSLVRPWLYAIARSEVHRRHRRVNKLQFTEPDEQAAMSSGGPTAEDLVHQQELRALFAEAANGLDPSDREVLDLHLRHSMTGAEIAAALGIPERQVGVVVQRVRERLGRSIGVVLLATKPKCAELAELQRTEGSPLTVLSRKRLARHIDGCLTCSQQLSDRMRPETLLAALPIALAPAFLRNGVLQRMAEVAHLATAGSTSAGTGTQPNGAPSGGTQPHAPSNGAPSGGTQSNGTAVNGTATNGSGGPSPTTNIAAPAGGQQPALSKAVVARALPQREGGRIWQTSDGFPRQAPPVRRFALIAIAASTLLVLFGVLVATGGNSEKRIIAGKTTIDARATLDDATTVTTPSSLPAPGASTTTSGTTTTSASPATTTPAVVLPTTPVVTAPPTVKPTSPTATTPPATTPPATTPPTTTPPPTTIAPDTAPPVFQSANANPLDISAEFNSAAACNGYQMTTVITANVTDDRGVASVTAHYTVGVNSYNKALSKVGNAWQVTIGPLPTDQFADGDYPINAQFTATDTSGNSRVSNVNSIAVLHDCLIIT